MPRSLRQISVAETDAEAVAIAEPAAMKHHEEINWLRNKHGVNGLTVRLNVPRAHDLAGMMKEGAVIAGSPATVLAEIQRRSACRADVILHSRGGKPYFASAP